MSDGSVLLLYLASSAEAYGVSAALALLCAMAKSPGGDSHRDSADSSHSTVSGSLRTVTCSIVPAAGPACRLSASPAVSYPWGSVACKQGLWGVIGSTMWSLPFFLILWRKWSGGIYIYTQECEHIYINMQIPARARACLYLHIYLHVYIYVHIYIYT